MSNFTRIVKTQLEFLKFHVHLAHEIFRAPIRNFLWCYIYVVVNFLSQLIFIFLLFWGMVMYAYEFETKEKQKLTKIKN